MRFEGGTLNFAVAARMAADDVAARAGELFVFGFEGTKADDVPAELIARSAGVILFRRNIESTGQLGMLTSAIRSASRPGGLAPLVAIDQEGGTVSRLAGIGTTTPSAMALGAVGDVSVTESMYRLIGDELTALGVNVDLAPVADVNNNPDNPVVGTRSFGDDPHAVARHVRAGIRGLRKAAVAATAKHFPGHGDTTIDSHVDLPSIPHDLGRMRDLELIPFAAAVAEKVDVIMTAHVLFPAVERAGVPATLSRPILTGLLRDEMGFDGVICSDCMEMSAIAERFTPAEAAVRSVAAGADLVLFSHTVEALRAAQAAVTAAVADGRLAPDQVRRSLERVRALRERLASRPRPPISDERALQSVGSEAHHNAALDAARRSITFIRDPKGVLPLALGAGEKVLVVQFAGAAGSGVEDPEGGAPHGRYVTVIGRALAAGPARVHEQVRSLDPAGHEYKQLLMAAGTANAIVAVTSRAKQHPLQARAVADLAMLGKRMVVIAGREPYDADVLPPEVTVLASFGEDANAMRAAADVVLGAMVARGTLPVRLASAASAAQ